MTAAGALLETNATDDQLVAAVRDGRDSAFEELYARYQRRVRGFVAGMVADRGRAEDLTQEVFVSALRRMRATDRPIAFKPWVYEIARNACIDEHRRTRRSSRDVSFDAEEGAAAARDAGAAASTSPDAAVQAKQQLDDLCGAFGGLSDSHHDILVMRELEGLSYREIGDRLGLSRPSVESTLFRARRRLTEEYADLVSGERCRTVRALLASGAGPMGVRDERRLARHVAHCQPCRRAAYAAGVDMTALTRHRRRDFVRRIAGVFPAPAFLRLSQLASPAAEPAAGWTKALAAAAVLAAGGAGIAAHDDGAGSAATRPAARPAAPAAPAAHERPAAQPSREQEPARSSFRTRRRASGHTAPRRHAAHRTVAIRRSSGGARQTGIAPPATHEAPAAARTPPTPAATSAPAKHTAASAPAPTAPTAAPKQAVTPVVHQATGTVQKAVEPVTTTVTSTASNAVDQVQQTAGNAVDGVVGGLGP